MVFSFFFLWQNDEEGKEETAVKCLHNKRELFGGLTGQGVSNARFPTWLILGRFVIRISLQVTVLKQKVE